MFLYHSRSQSRHETRIGVGRFRKLLHPCGSAARAAVEGSCKRPTSPKGRVSRPDPRQEDRREPILTLRHLRHLRHRVVGTEPRRTDRTPTIKNPASFASSVNRKRTQANSGGIDQSCVVCVICVICVMGKRTQATDCASTIDSPALRSSLLRIRRRSVSWSSPASTNPPTSPEMAIRRGPPPAG